MHIKNLHWIVVEDGSQTYSTVEKIIQRTTNLYTYISYLTPSNYPSKLIIIQYFFCLDKGWSQRNAALKFIRDYYKNYQYNAVVYFGDDDNAYDIRLFNYIRKVKKVGIWAVGLCKNLNLIIYHVFKIIFKVWLVEPLLKHHMLLMVL